MYITDSAENLPGMATFGVFPFWVIITYDSKALVAASSVEEKVLEIEAMACFGNTFCKVSEDLDESYNSRSWIVNIYSYYEALVSFHTKFMWFCTISIVSEQTFAMGPMSGSFRVSLETSSSLG
jgi:hypothetical protein